MPAPAVLSGVRELTLSSDRHSPPGEGADRLARRIEAATDDRYRVTSIQGGDTDLSYGGVWRHAGLHRAFHRVRRAAVVAGPRGLRPADLACRRRRVDAVGGAGRHHRPQAPRAGHTGPSGGVWASARLEAVADLAGARVHAEGLAADVLSALGAAPAVLSSPDLREALADGRLQAAEWLGPIAAVAPDLQPLAQRLYQPGFTARGMLLVARCRRAAVGRA